MCSIQDDKESNSSIKNQSGQNQGAAWRSGSTAWCSRRRGWDAHPGGGSPCPARRASLAAGAGAGLALVAAAGGGLVLLLVGRHGGTHGVARLAAGLLLLLALAAEGHHNRRHRAGRRPGAALVLGGSSGRGGGCLRGRSWSGGARGLGSSLLLLSRGGESRAGGLGQQPAAGGGEAGGAHQPLNACRGSETETCSRQADRQAQLQHSPPWHCTPRTHPCSAIRYMGAAGRGAGLSGSGPAVSAGKVQGRPGRPAVAATACSAGVRRCGGT